MYYAVLYTKQLLLLTFRKPGDLLEFGLIRFSDESVFLRFTLLNSGPDGSGVLLGLEVPLVLPRDFNCTPNGEVPKSVSSLLTRIVGGGCEKKQSISRVLAVCSFVIYNTVALTIITILTKY